MIRDDKGSMTAFLAMLFLVFLLLISMCAEGIYLYVGKGKAMGAYMAGLSHSRGNYQKELEEMYHIFGLDPRYQKKLPDDFTKKVKESLEESKDSFRFQTGRAKILKESYLTDQKGEILKYQIGQLMKYEMPADAVSSWKDKWENTKNAGKKMSQVQEKLDEEPKENEEKKEKPKGTKAEKDPRKGFMSLLRRGSVSLVLGKKKVSGQTVSIKYAKKDRSKNKIWNFMKKDATKKEIGKAANISSGTSLHKELPSVLYSLKYFHCLTSKEKKEGLQYEVEYLVSGKEEEKDNLGTVLWKIIGLRFLSNAAYVYQDPAKQKEAALIAASVLGVTALPPLVAAAKNLLLAALAYGESVIDVRNLAAGNQVPLWKNASDWQLSFSGLGTLRCVRKPVKKGLSYEDYLGILLIMQKDRKQKYQRMMDVMEHNVKRKVPDFQMDQCAASYQVSLQVGLRPLKFGGMALPAMPALKWNFCRFAVY